MTGTAKKNASDVRTFERLLRKADYSPQTYEEWALLDKIDQGTAIVAAINIAEKQNGDEYPNDWFPNFVNSIQRVFREKERQIWRQKLMSREWTEKDVPKPWDWQNDIVLEPVRDAVDKKMQNSYTNGT